MLNNEQIAILDYLADGKRRSLMEIGSWVGISNAKAEVVLQSLIELGYQIKVGTHSVLGMCKRIDYRLEK